MSSGIWADPHRPIYHFMPDRERYRINDPNGLIQWKGRYHLFYQFSPHGPYLDDTHWGHAVSDDLVHWEHLPIALSPDAGGPDADGCYSGCAVVHDGTPTIIYTGISPEERPCLATSDDDDLREWTKYPGNPVIKNPPPGLEMVGFRDHSAWREDGHWYQVIGGGIEGAGGDALLYRSADLIDWKFLGSLMAEPLEDRGTMWECPDFFALGDRHVLIASRLPHETIDDVWRARVRYSTGEYRDHKFYPEQVGILDAGGNFYAPQTMLDDDGTRLMWGWITEGRSREAQRIAGWTGVISLPRILSLDDSGRLLQSPTTATDGLRSNHRRIEDVTLGGGASVRLDDVTGDSLEIKATFRCDDAGSVGISVRCSPDGTERTRIVADLDRNTLTIDRSASSLDPETLHTVETGAMPRASKNGYVEVRLFLDRSVLEVFAGGYAAASRMYPMRADSLGLEVFAERGQARLVSLDSWDMLSIW